MEAMDTCRAKELVDGVLQKQVSSAPSLSCHGEQNDLTKRRAR